MDFIITYKERTKLCAYQGQRGVEDYITIYLIILPRKTCTKERTKLKLLSRRKEEGVKKTLKFFFFFSLNRRQDI